MGSLAFSDIQISTMNSSTDVVEVIYTGGTTNFVLPTNTSVVLSKAGSNPTQGNGTLYVNISYRKLKLNSTF